MRRPHFARIHGRIRVILIALISTPRSYLCPVSRRRYIEYCIDYSEANAPLQRTLEADDVGAAAAFLCSPLAAAITGVNLYVYNGIQVMAASIDAASFQGYKFSYPFDTPGMPK